LPSDITALKARQQKLLDNPGALCNMVKRIAVDAGEILLKYYDGIEDMQVATKRDDSPVTLADREAEGFIQMSLEMITPDIPMIGEEGVALGKAPKISSTQEYFWLVDPLDGTKEFISGGNDFTVNIALIRNGVPILGVVLVPVTGEIYSGHGKGTARRYLEETKTDKEISVRPTPKSGLIVVSSKNHGDAGKLDKFLESFKVEKVIKRGSSLKITAIAAGKADLYPRFGPTCEWDTAAADAVLRAAGGIITDLNGQPLKYGGANPKWLNPEFIACSFKWFEED
jgi:3'(2'), 5'-bisphosphate nucleotidase